MRVLTRFSRDERGFTLIEALAAIVLIALIAVPVANLAVATARNAALARDHLRATTLAQSALEDLRARGFAAATSQPATPLPDAPGFIRQIDVVAEPTAAEQAQGRPASLKRVTVTVAFRAGARRVTLGTLLSATVTP